MESEKVIKEVVEKAVVMALDMQEARHQEKLLSSR